MANPQIQQVIQKVDEFLAGYPTLFQYGALVLDHGRVGGDNYVCSVDGGRMERRIIYTSSVIFLQG